MHLRAPVTERRDPDEPGLRVRPHARIGVCREPTTANRAWLRFNRAGQAPIPVVGPVPAASGKRPAR